MKIVEDIRSAVISIMHDRYSTLFSVSFRDLTINKKTIPKNKLIIKSDNIDYVEKHKKFLSSKTRSTLLYLER